AKAGDAGSGVAALGGKAQAAAPVLARLSGAERQAATTAKSLAQTHHLAAGSVGNLTSQFNDIGVMLASGQNPLQLALQQGTQITQVIGPLGAGGAVKALGAAFLQMLNPVSLITIGSIAAGAAMFQWLTAAGDEALTLEERIDALATAVQAYTASAAAAGSSTDDLTKKYGVLAEEARRALADIAAADRADALRNVRQSVADLAVQFGDLRGLTDDMGASLKDGLSANDLARDLGISSDAGLALVNALRDLDGASGLEAQAQGAEKVRVALLAAFGSVTAMPEEIAKTFRNLAEVSKQAAAVAGATTAKAAVDAAAAADLLASLRAQNTLQATINEHGRDSSEVAQLRAEAERAANEEMLAGLDVAESFKDQLRLAFEEGQRLAAVDIQSGIAAAASTAAQLAKELGISLRAASAILALGEAGPVILDPRDPRFDQTKATATRLKATAARLKAEAGTVSPFDPRRSEISAGAIGSAGARASGAISQRNATADLIAQQQRELDLLREADPVQREMLRHRDALTGATEAERREIETLISTRLKEAAAIEASRASYDFLADAGFDALDGIALRGGKAADVMNGLKQSIASAALQALIMGRGPLAGLFGVSSPVFSGLLGGGGGGTGALGLPLPFASGGPIRGPGSGTSDDVLIAASNGEFMVNARAAAQHRHLLEAINAGSVLPRFAGGGSIGGDRPASGRAAQSDGAGEITIQINGARGNAEITEMVSQGVSAALKSFNREVLPHRVRQISGGDRRVG
ncbi:MAG: phage tail length tape measure family protein, partial [Paracoccaceae bacterium]|nr:phage tail length tape measure family protein [Paracoccaceae bacterium]